MTTLARGNRIALRRVRGADIDALLAAHVEGEWRELDAPFEPVETDPIVLTEHVLRWCEDASEPPRRALIVNPADEVLGSVNRYGSKRFPASASLGVGLFRARHWGRGLGAEALTLWIDLLFEGAAYHRLDLQTWSLNPRMIRLARKLGFRPEGVERELVEWRGEWLDRHRFGLLRSEWQAARDRNAGAGPA